MSLWRFAQQSLAGSLALLLHACTFPTQVTTTHPHILPDGTRIVSWKLHEAPGPEFHIEKLRIDYFDASAPQVLRSKELRPGDRFRGYKLLPASGTLVIVGAGRPVPNVEICYLWSLDGTQLLTLEDIGGDRDIYVERSVPLSKSKRGNCRSAVGQ